MPMLLAEEVLSPDECAFTLSVSNFAIDVNVIINYHFTHAQHVADYPNKVDHLLH